MPFILALDQGTTSSRAIVFEHTGAIRSVAQQPFRQIYPQPGWVEHDPMEILDTQMACARQALREARLNARDIAAIGIANQRETTLIWERKTGRPIHNAIVWQDRRAASWCEAQRAAGLEDTVRDKTGLLLDPYLSAGKIVWMLDQVSDARARAGRGELAFGTVDTWLLWHLTGGALHATDVSNASRSLVYDIHRRDWDDELLTAFGIPRTLLPEVRPSSGDFGMTAQHWFASPVRIAGVAGDQQAALFGQGCVTAGQAKNTYGTGCFMLMHTGTHAYPSRHGLLTSAAASISAPGLPSPEYVLEGSVFSAGSAVQWLRDGLGLIATAAEVEPLAASVPDTDGVYLVPAFTGLGSPYWDARARGTIVGITRGTNRAHLARAALEAIALQSAELLEAMHSDSGLVLSELRVDGGATANNLLMQMQADLIGVPVLRPRVQESTAQGASDLAALAAGLWPDAAAIARHRRGTAIERVFEPRASRDWAQARLAEWKRAVQRSLEWAK